MGPLPTDDAGEYWKAFSEAGDEIAENMRAVIATLRAENEALRAQIASIRDETLEEAAKVAERDGSSHAAPYPHDATWQRNAAQQVIAADRIAAAIRARSALGGNNG
jgi:hypothetical protein